MRKYKIKNNPCVIEYYLEKYDTHMEVCIDFVHTPSCSRRLGYAKALLVRFISTMGKYECIYLYAVTYFGMDLDILIRFYESVGFRLEVKKDLWAKMEYKPEGR